MYVLTTLVVQVEQSDSYVWVCGCLDKQSDLWPRYLACWFTWTYL